MVTNGLYWIGLSQSASKIREPDGDWYWKTSGGNEQPAKDIYWLSDQPDNWENNEHCASVLVKSTGAAINDVPCKLQLTFICQYHGTQKTLFG